jgi:SOS-response transcriptional repressor LexA
MSNSYEVTGFQSACAEFAEKPLSLDERYLQNRPATFIIEAASESRPLGIRRGDRLIIDRSLKPRVGQLVLLVVNNEFRLSLFHKNMVMGEDSDSNDFVWGVITTLIREFSR